MPSAELALSLRAAIPLARAWMADSGSPDKRLSSQMLEQIYTERGIDGVVDIVAGLQAIVEILADEIAGPHDLPPDTVLDELALRLLEDGLG